MDNQTNLRYTFLREKYKNIGGDKKCKRYNKSILFFIDLQICTFKLFQQSFFVFPGFHQIIYILIYIYYILHVEYIVHIQLKRNNNKLEVILKL